MVIGEVDSDPERDAIAQNEDVDDYVRGEGQAAGGPVKLLVFFRLLRLVLTSLAGHVLDNDGVSRKSNGSKQAHQDWCPGADDCGMNFNSRLFVREYS